MSQARKPLTPPLEIGPAVQHAIELLGEVLHHQKTVILSTLLEVSQQLKRTDERVNLLMSSIQDLSNLQAQLAVDTDQQSKDIGNVQSALNANVAAVNQAITFLKQGNPNLDLTVLQASVRTLEQNHQTLVDLANNANNAAASAQTTMQANLQGASSGGAGAVPQPASADATTPAPGGTAATEV